MKKGKGVEIKYVNNGVPNSTQEWNKFLEGFQILINFLMMIEVEPRVWCQVKSITGLDLMRTSPIFDQW